MKDAYEVLYQKEEALARVRREIESLKAAAQILSDDHLTFLEPDPPLDSQDKKPAQKATSPEPTAAEPTFYVWPRRGFWGNLKTKR